MGTLIRSYMWRCKSHKYFCGYSTDSKGAGLPMCNVIVAFNWITGPCRLLRNSNFVMCANVVHINRVSHIQIASIASTSMRWDKTTAKPSSKVEITVQELKKHDDKPPVKLSLKERVIHELQHYYHGFRLLFIDMKVSTILICRVLKGKSLTRREYRLLIRTVGDMFRLVPFSVFIIVPFMEFLLPVFIKFFPGMLPSTFQTAKEKEDKIMQNLKIKIEMAKFLQETLDNMTPLHKEHRSTKAKEFSEWFHKVRTSGEQMSNEDIMKYAQLFEDEITLDSLSRSQLIALCRVLEVQTLGTNNFLRFQLRMKLRALAVDDKMIQKEGVESLTLTEVQQACRARGMRAYGLPESRLRSQLNQWLVLSLNEKVPPSLLLLSRAMMLPETIPTSDKLKATISALPETIVAQTQAAIAEKEGKIDNKTKLEVLKEEVRKVKEEQLEQKQEKAMSKAQVLVDKAPILTPTGKDLDSTPILKDTAQFLGAIPKPAVTEQVLSQSAVAAGKQRSEDLRNNDLKIIETAIDQVSIDKEFIVEKEELKDLKMEMADYKEDVEDLQREVAKQATVDIKESKAAKRLYKSVDKMIRNLDTLLDNLQQKEQQLKEQLADDGKPTTDAAQAKEELLKIDDIIDAIRRIKDVPDQNRIEKIITVLKKMDSDHDGSIKVEDVLKVFAIIGKENVNLSNTQIDELILLLDKEEILEVEDKIEKAIQKNIIKEEEEKRQKAQGSLNHSTKSTSGVDKNEIISTKSSTKECKDLFTDKCPPGGSTVPPVKSPDSSKPSDAPKSL